MASFSGFFVKSIIDVAARSGCPQKKILSQFKLDIGDLQQSTYRLEGDLVLDLIAFAIQTSGDDALGLHIGESVRPSSFSALGYTIMSSRNLEDAIMLNKKYGRLVADFGVVSIEKSSSHVITHLECPEYHADLVRPLNEAFLTAWWVYSKWIIGQDTSLMALNFAHQAPGYISEYERIYDIIPHFGASTNNLKFDPAYLHIPIKEFDPDVCSIMKRKTSHLLNHMRTSSDICQEVANQIRQLLPSGRAKLPYIAERLSISERVLRRRLKAKGSSYQLILDNIRKSIALDYLADPNQTIKAISLSLGYNEQSTFASAFKKWTGFSPTEFREHSLSS